MRPDARCSRLTLVALTLLLAGCGARPQLAAPVPGAGPVRPIAQPSAPRANPAPLDAIAQAPVGFGQPGPAGFTAPLARAQELTARQVAVKNGFFYGLGKFRVSIEVANPSDLARTGVLTVAFLDGKQRTDHNETAVIALGPREKRTFDFEDARSSIDNVAINITTDPVAIGLLRDIAAPAPGAFPSY